MTERLMGRDQIRQLLAIRSETHNRDALLLLDELEDEIQRLYRAIRPFAEIAAKIPDNWPEDCVLTFVEDENPHTYGPGPGDQISDDQQDDAGESYTDEFIRRFVHDSESDNRDMDEDERSRKSQSYGAKYLRRLSMLRPAAPGSQHRDVGPTVADWRELTRVASMNKYRVFFIGGPFDGTTREYDDIWEHMFIYDSAGCPHAYIRKPNLALSNSSCEIYAYSYEQHDYGSVVVTDQ